MEHIEERIDATLEELLSDESIAALTAVACEGSELTELIRFAKVPPNSNSLQALASVIIDHFNSVINFASDLERAKDHR